MSESLVYEIIKREGHQEGHREGLQQGMLDEAREMVVQVVQVVRVKFGRIPASMQAQIEQIASRITLSALHEQAIRSESLEQFREALQQTLEG